MNAPFVRPPRSSEELGIFGRRLLRKGVDVPEHRQREVKLFDLRFQDGTTGDRLKRSYLATLGAFDQFTEDMQKNVASGKYTPAGAAQQSMRYAIEQTM